MPNIFFINYVLFQSESKIDYSSIEQNRFSSSKRKLIFDHNENRSKKKKLDEVI